MDRRDAMSLSGSTSYYMQRGMVGSGSVSQASPNIAALGNPSLSFQSNIGGSSVAAPLSVEPSSAVQSHGTNVAVLSTVPSSEPVRRKRGRPRKYGHDGTVSLALSPLSSPAKLTPIQKRGRGRPPGTGRKQQMACLGEWLSGSAGMGFTPHVITIAVGEDITTKIMSFSQQGPRVICILSANGAVSTVTLRQPSTSGGTVTYEGRFEILCLSGSYLPTDSNGTQGRTGGLNVSLASPDGRVVGGGVGGVLIAATPVQVIVGSFLCGSSKAKNNKAEGGNSLESGGDSEHHTADDSVAQAGLQPTQQALTPSSSMGVWPGARPVDLQDAHVDIDLMRG